ncbi:MAG: substrate-binding periplasmic protein [Spirochaetota bacterium]
MKYLIAAVYVFFSILPAGAQSLSIYCEESPPYQISENGAPAGMTVEIVREIQKRTGNTDPIQMTSWNRAYTAALKEKNAVIFSMVKTDERKDLFQWVGPVADLSLAFYSKKGSQIRVKSHNDAKKVNSIGVYVNDVSDQYLTKLGYTNLVRSYDDLISLKNLIMGRIDLVSVGKSAYRKYAETAGVNPDDLEENFVFMRSSLYIVFSKSTPSKTVYAWKSALASMKKDGTFAAIYLKYFPGTTPP